MNMELLKEFTREEVRAALQQMVPLKALRSDGFTADFFLKKTGPLWVMRYVAWFLIV